MPTGAVICYLIYCTQDKYVVRRFLEKFIPGTGRAKHPGNDLLVDSMLCLPDASPLQG